MTRAQRTAPIFFLALTAVLSTPTLHAQTAQLGGGFGLALPAADFGGSTEAYYTGDRYGASSGPAIFVKGRLGLLGIHGTAEIQYAMFSNNGFSEPGQGNVDLDQHILSLRVGPEFDLSLPGSSSVPYVGANIALNAIGGTTAFQGVSKVPTATYSVATATRVGFGLTAGLLMKIGPLLNLDLGVAYNFVNAFGNKFEDSNPAQDVRLDSYMTLNDEADPRYATGDDKHFISAARSIQTFEIKAAVLFGL